MWWAIGLGILIVAGGAGHLWLSYQRLQGATVVVEAAAGPAGEGGLTAGNTPGQSQAPAAEPAVPCPEHTRLIEEASGPGAGARPAALAPAAATDATTSISTDPLRAPEQDTRININVAQPAELQRLPGIGPALAGRIVEYRQAWGPFSAIEDIMEVPGIGPRKFEDMKELIKVD